MNNLWKRTLLIGCVAVGLLLAPVFAAEGQVRNLLSVSVATDQAGQPIVELLANGPLEFETLVLDGPDRLVIDLNGTISRLDDYRFPVDLAGVVQVRASQHLVEPVPVTRVVFDLMEPLAYHISELDDRLVLSFGDETANWPAVVSTTTEIEAVQRPIDLHDEVVTEKPEAIEPEVIEPEVIAEETERSMAADEIDRLIGESPSLAAPAPSPEAQSGVSGNFESRRIGSGSANYTGKRISLNLVDADIKEVFRLFHEISGLNFVLDPGVSGRVTIVLDQVPWDQALDLILKNNGLDKVLENNVLRIASTQKLAQEAASRQQLKEAEELEVEPVTMTRTLSYAKAAEVELVIRNGGVLSPRGRVIVDERTNTLIISDIPKRVEPLDQLISTLDTQTPQVVIEARIVETSRSYTKSLGVTWGLNAIADASRGTSTGLSFPHNASVGYGLNLPGDSSSTLGFSLGNVVDSFTLDLELNALETEGKSRTLSAPKIATQNNERAEIEQGVRIPIVNTTATEINVEFVSASLRLIVTPQITAEGTVILDVVVENNSPDFVQTAGEIPSIRTQRAQTKLLIKDGGTSVIGGIFTHSEGANELGVPWFRKIPLFGWLFRSQNVNKEDRELLIFLTPKIVKFS